MNKSSTSRGRAAPRGDRPGLRPSPGRPRTVDEGGRPNFPAMRIEQVQRVLDEILQWAHPADAILSLWLRANPKLGGRDRGEIAEAVYDVLRHLRRYRRLVESSMGPARERRAAAAERPPARAQRAAPGGLAIRRLAILGLVATLGPERLAEGLRPDETEWLSHVLQIDPATLPLAVRHSMPDWLAQRLEGHTEAERLMQALNQPAPLDLRANPFKIERDALLDALRDGPGARYRPTPMPYSPWGIRVAGHPPVSRWPQFEQGSLEVQDEGSQLLSLLVAPRRGEMVIDFCAGAGGKTLLLGALMRSTGRLYAFDVSAARLARAKPRFARSGLSNVVPVVIENENDARIKRLAGKAQRVLVDAPCSGIGTLRRNPDLKWRQHAEALAQLADLQHRILKSAARCVAPGGRLVYATCSLLDEENARQAERFLAEHPDFERLDAAALLTQRVPVLSLAGPYMQLRPDLHGTDGFFAAVFERRKAAKTGPGAPAQDAATPENAREPLKGPDLA